MNADEEIGFLSGVEIAAAIRARKMSPVEIVAALLRRIEALNPVLNAYVTVAADAAMAEAQVAESRAARGGDLPPLLGVPVSTKDSFETKNLRTTFGSRVFANYIPVGDAPLVERLRRSGAIVIGKTAMPEFAWKAMTDSPLQGVTRNPWSLDHTPGGSSGGASAQMAAGLGPLAVGTDGGGSIRIPASFTGVFGIKPSFGRIPVYPSSSFDALSHPGPITRTVADSAAMLAVMAGPHSADRFSLEAPPQDYIGLLGAGVAGLRVAWSPDLGYAKVDAEVAAVTAAAASVFEELGCAVEEVDPKFGDPLELYEVFLQVGAAAAIQPHRAQWERELDPGLVAIANRGAQRGALELARAQIERNQLYDRMRRFFDVYDLLLTPTVAVLPFRAGAASPPPEQGRGEDWPSWTPFSFPFNLTQLPAASVPGGFSQSGLPIGLQIVGRRFADLTVLQAAAAYESARPWADRRPTLSIIRP